MLEALTTPDIPGLPWSRPCGAWMMKVLEPIPFRPWIFFRDAGHAGDAGDAGDSADAGNAGQLTWRLLSMGFSPRH